LASQFVAVVVFQDIKLKGWSCMTQTHNTHVKLSVVLKNTRIKSVSRLGTVFQQQYTYYVVMKVDGVRSGEGILLPCFRAAFASWLLMNLLLVVVPRYGAFAMIVTGVLLLSTDLVYYMLIPYNPLVVRFEGSALMFRLGWCFWLVMTAGTFKIAQSPY
jgi:hypothetical protein